MALKKGENILNFERIFTIIVLQQFRLNKCLQIFVTPL